MVHRFALLCTRISPLPCVPRSSDTPVPAELTLCTATWLQAPGAAPQSTTLYPGCRRWNLSSISSSLKALLHRKFSACDALTYGSLRCRSIQRCSAGVFPFVKHDEEWRSLLKRHRHIVLTVTCSEMAKDACVESQLAIGQWENYVICVPRICVPLLKNTNSSDGGTTFVLFLFD